jgi:hypothetical protein
VANTFQKSKVQMSFKSANKKQKAQNLCFALFKGTGKLRSASSCAFLCFLHEKIDINSKDLTNKTSHKVFPDYQRFMLTKFLPITVMIEPHKLILPLFQKCH